MMQQNVIFLVLCVLCAVMPGMQKRLLKEHLQRGSEAVACSQLSKMDVILSAHAHLIFAWGHTDLWPRGIVFIRVNEPGVECGKVRII